MNLRVAVVAHGRFHAFDLARELRRLGHDVTLFSNYPAWAVERFGVGREYYRGFWIHGAVERLLSRVAPAVARRTEAARHRWFGRWAARALEGRVWDVVHGWSGVSEEWLTSTRVDASCRVLMRGSAHIAEQAALLEEEQERVGVPLDGPSVWMIARERREYELADRIVVLSEFARASFERQGIDGDRVTVVPLGVDVSRFRPSPAALAARIDRVRSGAPLSVLYVGVLSAQKGLFDLVAAARACEDLPIRFLLVGARVPETAAILRLATANVVEFGSRDQAELPAFYERADVFMFPTLQDGFGMVLTQAAAAGLVILATAQSAAPELIGDVARGWTLPMRSPQGFADRLRWCHEHRDELASILEEVAVPGRARTWADVAEHFAAEARVWAAAGVRRREAPSC